MTTDSRLVEFDAIISDDHGDKDTALTTHRPRGLFPSCRLLGPLTNLRPSEPLAGRVGEESGVIRPEHSFGDTSEMRMYHSSDGFQHG